LLHSGWQRPRGFEPQSIAITMDHADRIRPETNKVARRRIDPADTRRKESMEHASRTDLKHPIRKHPGFRDTLREV